MKIHSVQEYITLIEKLKTNYTHSLNYGKNIFASGFTYTPHFIFRGLGDIKYDLRPKVFRWKTIEPGKSCTEYSQLEYNILKDFISEACRFIKDVPVSDIPAWLEIAQHFGVPTRLLDFTENPLVALFFACSENSTTDARVWILNEYAYNRKLYNESGVVLAEKSQSIVNEIISREIVYKANNPNEANLSGIQFPWIYKPCYREERMNSQSSIFMIWGAQQNELTDFIAKEDYMTDGQVTNADHGIICSVVIPSDKKDVILQQLNILGINSKFIYPGIDGVGKYIDKKYSSENLQKGNSV